MYYFYVPLEKETKDELLKQLQKYGTAHRLDSLAWKKTNFRGPPTVRFTIVDTQYPEWFCYSKDSYPREKPRDDLSFWVEEGIYSEMQENYQEFRRLYQQIWSELQLESESTG